MDQNQLPLSPQIVDEPQENVFAGAVGAFLFALAGGIVWFILYLLGFLAAISGIVGVVCAIKGYEIFAHKESKKGVIISVVMAAVVLVIAWYFTLAYDVCEAYKEWYAEGLVDFTLTFAESLRVAPEFLKEPEIRKGYLIDLGLGLLFCVAGSFGYIRVALTRVKAKQNAAQAADQSPESMNPISSLDDQGTYTPGAGTDNGETAEESGAESENDTCTASADNSAAGAESEKNETAESTEPPENTKEDK